MLLLLFPAFLHAGAPFLTDDPAFPEKGWEIKYAVTYERNVDASVVNAPVLDLSYSLTKQFQVTLIGGGTVVKENGHWARAGVGDTAVQFKWRFLNESTNAWHPAVSLAPGVIMPTADADRGLGDGWWHLRLPVQFGKAFGDWYAFAEGGALFTLNGKGDVESIYGFGLQYQVTPKLALGVEINGNAHLNESSHHGLIGNVGATWSLNDRWQILGSVGRTLRSESLGGPKLLTQFFVVWTF